MTAVRALVTIGLASLWLALFVPPMFMWGHPTANIPGVDAIESAALLSPTRLKVERASFAYRAGLRTGDVLGCLSKADKQILEGAAYDGRPISMCVERGGHIRQIAFVAQMGPPLRNIFGGTAGTLVRIGIEVAFLLTGIALVILRPGLSTWLFFVYALGSAHTFSLEKNATLWPAALYSLAYGLTILARSAVQFLLLFSITVPDDGIPTGWRRRAFFAILPIVAAACAFQAWEIVQTYYNVSITLNYLTDQIGTVLTILVVLARLVTMSRAERARFGWAAFAIVAGAVAGDLRNVLTVFSTFGSAIAGYATIIMPLALMYAILTRHVIDVRFALSRTVAYAALTTLVVGVIGAVDWATSAYLHEARVAMALDAAVTIGVAFALNRVHHWLELGVDFLLFRKKYDAEHFLSRLGRTLLSATHEETVDRALVRDPQERLDLTFASLYRNSGAAFVLSASSGTEMQPAPAFDLDNDVVRFLNTERTRLPLGDLTDHAFGRSAVALPILEGHTMMGFVVYGIHRDGTTLDPDEIETLERLCDSAAQAYTYIEVSRYRAERLQLVTSTAI